MKVPVVALLAICARIPSIVAEDAACVTPDRKAGYCVEISRCKNIYAIVSDPNPSSVYDRYIQRATATCTVSVSGEARSVCCVPTEISPKAATTKIRINDDQQDKLALLPTDCGRSNYNRIAHGNRTEVFEYPWVVLLLYRHKGTTIGGCGGSLISSRYVLTAAHCIRTRSSLQLTQARLGEHTRSNTTDCNIYFDADGKVDEQDCADNAEDIGIESSVVHPEFNRPRRFSNDIGLIRLDRDVKMKDHIQPLCLPVNEQLRAQQFDKYIVAGWGATESGEGSDVLLKASVPHVSNEHCQQRMNRLNIQLTEKQMCAGGKDLVDTCRGDSGGPLGRSSFLHGSDRFIQFGVVSAGINSCGQKNVPGIYAKVAHYMSWILENIEP